MLILESELVALRITNELIAILVLYGVQKHRYLRQNLLSALIAGLIGDKMDNSFIALIKRQSDN